jgi:pimeloyl-ACP methyl ester carboxylesterase
MSETRVFNKSANMIDDDAPDFLTIPDLAGGPAWRIARRLTPATRPEAGPGLVWLGGFASDMTGTKAQFLAQKAQAQGRACLRFDYSGHGASEGRFTDGCIGDWLAQSVAVFEASTQGPQILIGSSMGGWLALLLARHLAAAGASARLAGLVMLAPAVDFTEELIWPELDAAARAELMEKGVWARPSDYAPEPTPITRRLIEDGRRHLLFGGMIRTHAPVHILQGMADPDVPWRHALRLVEHMSADPVTLSFIADGDHRLSRPQDLAQLAAAVDLVANSSTGQGLLA